MAASLGHIDTANKDQGASFWNRDSERAARDRHSDLSPVGPSATVWAETKAHKSGHRDGRSSSHGSSSWDLKGQRSGGQKAMSDPSSLRWSRQGPLFPAWGGTPSHWPSPGRSPWPLLPCGASQVSAVSRCGLLPWPPHPALLSDTLRPVPPPGCVSEQPQTMCLRWRQGLRPHPDVTRELLVPCWRPKSHVMQEMTPDS